MSSAKVKVQSQDFSEQGVSRIPKARGRPTLYTEALVTRLCGLIASGMSIEGACALCGISHDTYAAWQRCRPGFKRRVMVADAECEKTLVESAMRGASKDGKLAIQVLERRHGARWAKPENSTVSHAHVHAIATPEILQKLSDSRRLADSKVIDVECEPKTNPK
jgi:hypothetical protein